jgi:SAM-dependent methyltransferase
LREDFPLSQQCLAELKQQMPFLYKATAENSNLSLEHRLPLLEEILQRLNSNSEEKLRSCVKAYVTICIEFLKLQRQLERTKTYLYSTEEETLEMVYQNKDLFCGYYLEGLLLTQALWPNHFMLMRNFQDSFLPTLSPETKVLEVGTGMGLHLRYMLKRAPALNYTGLDISPHAIDFAKRFVSDVQTRKSQLKFLQTSVTDPKGLDFQSSAFGCVIMGEVLEHIEKPLETLRELIRITKGGGHLFLTTVVFAAAIDHIYLFHNAEEVLQLCRAAGWKIDKTWVYPIYENDTPDVSDRPMNIALILRKPS